MQSRMMRSFPSIGNVSPQMYNNFKDSIVNHMKNKRNEEAVMEMRALEGYSLMPSLVREELIECGMEEDDVINVALFACDESYNTMILLPDDFFGTKYDSLTDLTKWWLKGEMMTTDDSLVPWS